MPWYVLAWIDLVVFAIIKFGAIFTGIVGLILILLVLLASEGVNLYVVCQRRKEITERQHGGKRNCAKPGNV